MRLAMFLFVAVTLPLFSQPAFERIDAHVHVSPPPPVFLEMLDRAKVRLLNVTLVDPTAPGFDKPEPQSTWAAGIAKGSEGRISWAAALDPSGFESPDFARREIERLGAHFARGAVAVKIYKSVGINIKSTSGNFLMPDDAVLSPVLAFLASRGKTLLAHLGEPRSSWQPLDAADPHYRYYKENPEWHMYRHPEAPSWEAIIAARDRMLAAHPDLKVVGAHLGSMEHDVEEIAHRLEKYPNLAVDTAARMPDLMRQPREKVRRFLIRHQDRVLWGTDLMQLDWSNPAKATAQWEAAYDRDWKYFATKETIQVGALRVQGLALPDAVLRKIFRENALRWMPGLAPALTSRREPPNGAALPTAEQVLQQYLAAMGGEAALRKVHSRAFSGIISVSTYGVRGSYQEFAQSPDRLQRIFRFPGYGVFERVYDGQRAWEESPEYGVELLSGARLSEVRRQAVFHLPLEIGSVYKELRVAGRDTIDGQAALVLQAVTADGERDTLWFSEDNRLLLGFESTETFANGVKQRVRYLFEDYETVDGIPVALGVRYESPRMIWVLKRQVAHNPELDGSRFQPPNGGK
ncbi:MAG: amidohydrolase family protein [Bryobacterales bacterium]|nr:amidohydrolase family protein [Bryobacterales bacterium]